MGGRDLEDRAVSGGHRLHHAAAAAGGPADQRHLLGLLQRRGHHVSAGEAHRRYQAVEVFIGHGVLGVKLMVQVEVGTIHRRGHGTGRHVLDAEGRVAQKPRQHQNRRVHIAAGVVRQIQHYVLDGAVRSRDLLMGMEDQRHGVVQFLALLLCLIVGRAEVGRFEFVEGDVRRVPDLFILQPSVRVLLVPGLAVFVPVLAQLAVGNSRAVGDGVQAREVGVFVEDRVEIVKIEVDDRLQRVVRIHRVVPAEDLVISDLPEEVPEARDVMGFLQAVEGVKCQAKLVVAVLRQRVAAFSGGRVVIDLRNLGVAPFAVIEEEVVIGQEKRLSVEHDAHQGGEQREVVQRLQRDVAVSVLGDHFNPVGPQIHDHLIAVAVEGRLFVSLEEHRLSVFIRPGFRNQINQRGVVGIVHERVIVDKLQEVVCKVEGQGVAVFPFKDYFFIPVIDVQAVTRIAADVGVEEIHQLCPVCEFHIGQVVHAVDEVEGEVLIQRVVCRFADIERIGLFDDAVRTGALRLFGLFSLFGLYRRRAGQDQQECQQHGKPAGFGVVFHVLGDPPFLKNGSPAAAIMEML